MTQPRRNIDCCAGCDKRRENCHASCEDYKRQRQERQEYIDAVKRGREGFQDYLGYKVKIHPYKHKTRRKK